MLKNMCWIIPTIAASVISIIVFTKAKLMESKYEYGIIGAMDLEIDTLVGDLENKKEEKKYGLTFYMGKLKKYEVVIVKCGIGKVNAGRTTQVLISEYSPKYIINTGIGGGLNQQLKIGDIIISTDLI